MNEDDGAWPTKGTKPLRNFVRWETATAERQGVATIESPERPTKATEAWVASHNTWDSEVPPCSEEAGAKEYDRSVDDEFELVSCESGGEGPDNTEWEGQNSEAQCRRGLGRGIASDSESSRPPGGEASQGQRHGSPPGGEASQGQ